MSSEQTAAPATPSTFSLPKLPASPLKATSPHGLDSLPVQLHRTACIHTPLCIVHNIQTEEVVHLGTNTLHLMPGLQAPGAFAKDPDEAGGVTTMEDSVPALSQDSKVMESAFMAKTTETGTGGVNPNDTVAYSAAAQGGILSGELGTEDIALVDVATLTLNINDPKPLLAPVPHLADSAPTSAAECTITCDVPFHGAVNTFNWATSATHLCHISTCILH